MKKNGCFNNKYQRVEIFEILILTTAIRLIILKIYELDYFISDHTCNTQCTSDCLVFSLHHLSM